MTAYADQALVVHLAAKGSTSLHARALELPGLIGDWLTYTVTTFPHFTSHTSRHSEEIVAQLSQLLFHDGDPDRPAVDLSPMEAYLLVAGAFLHDAGMVVSDEEKTELLGSDAWRQHIASGPSRDQWEEAEALRRPADEHGAPKDPPRLARDVFQADRLVRFMLADHYRRVHHNRAGELVLRRTELVGRFTFDDQTLARPLADICRGHGLAPADLEDPIRYPHKVQVRGDLVNVRFLAHLLRIGDLLDLDSQRACPLLLSAVAPLPLDSLSHWSHHQRITQRLTSVEEIRLRAECNDQAEHRNLRDWTQWMADEVALTESTMVRTSRHKGWVAPRCSLDGPRPTITIEPAPEATYIPRDWTFRLDLDNVLQRLITDAYRTEHAWLRELIQNALDTTRCRLLDLARAAGARADSPSDVAEEIREAHPVTVAIDEVAWPNPLTQADETHVRVTVEDLGMGMDQRIIEDFFLQIGRSYYTTREFRDAYGFVPISRFGIGFLSVFGASNDVVVETWTGRETDQPLRITLTGPRSYLLVEKGRRADAGTSVTVRISAELQPRTLAHAVENWCRMMEVPVVVRLDDGEKRHRAPRYERRETETPLDPSKGLTIVERSLPIDRADLTGRLGIRFLRGPAGDDWTWFDRAAYSYFLEHPLAPKPGIVKNVVCAGGLLTGEQFTDGTFDVEVNLRRETDHGLDRGSYGIAFDAPTLVRPELEELVSDHLASGATADEPDAWSYRQTLSSTLPFLEDFWDRQPGMIPCHVGGRIESTTLVEALAQPRPIAVEIDLVDGPGPVSEEWTASAADRFDLPEPFILGTDLALLSERHGRRLISACRYRAEALPSSDEDILRFVLIPEPGQPSVRSVFDQPFMDRVAMTADLSAVDLVAIRFGFYPGLVLVDESHAIAAWWRDMQERATDGSPAARVLDEMVGLITVDQISGQAEGESLASWVQKLDRPDRTGLAPMPELRWPDTPLDRLTVVGAVSHLRLLPTGARGLSGRGGGRR